MSRGRGRDNGQQGYSGYRDSQAPTNTGYTPSTGQSNDYYSREYASYPQDSTYGSQHYGTHGQYAQERERPYYDPPAWDRQHERGYDGYYAPAAQYSSHAYDNGNNWNDYSQRYEDYNSYAHQSGSSREYAPLTSYGTYSGYRMAPESAYPPVSGYSDYRNPERPHEYEYEERRGTGGYTDYRASEMPPHSRAFSSNARPPPPIRPRERSPSGRSPLPQRTLPRPAYQVLAKKPSSHLADPSTARKLLVLDLNGSLLLRAAHKRAEPTKPQWAGRGNPNRGGSPVHHPQDPYADPAALRPLRAVHRRPYLGSFTSYVLHDSTKAWLDTMVWSSAQPHSVADMVEQCFGDRKSELKEVWARDTLGLSAEDYHKKSITLKDLEKPWTKFCDGPSPSSPTLSRSSHVSSSPNDSRSSHITSSPTIRSSNAASSPARSPKASPILTRGALQQGQTLTALSALNTLLVDDSPAKAAIQPWNHLVIPEYLQALRNADMKVADREARRPKNHAKGVEASPAKRAPSAEIEAGELTEPPRSASPTSPPPPGMTRVIREVVMIEGTMVDPDKSIVEDRLVSMADLAAATNPGQRRKAKRVALRESLRAVRAEKEREAFEELRARKAAIMGLSPPEPLPKEPTKAEMRYDETLLAVVGVLDCLKHENNVAGWMHSGGLLKTATDSPAAPTPDPVSTNVDSVAPVATGEKHAAPSRGASPASATNSDAAGPAKRRRLSLSTISPGDVKDADTTNDGNKGAQEARASQVQPPSTAEAQATTGVPLSAPVPSPAGSATVTASLTGTEGEARAPKGHTPAGLWYEDKAVLEYWATRGRRALDALGIAVESGIIPGNPPSKKGKGKANAGAA